MNSQKAPRSAFSFSILSQNTRRREVRLGDVLVRLRLLSPLQLRGALRAQRTQARPLGRILIHQGSINTAQLGLGLALQGTIRGALALMILTLVLFAGPERKAQAGQPHTVDVPAALMVVAAPPAAEPTAQQALFGMGEQQSTQTESFTKWHEMFSRFADQAQDSPVQEQLAQLRAKLAPLAHLSMKEQALAVNALMNKQPYIADQENWGRSDYWETPVEFLDKGGDCEDFAIAKYAALRALGVPDNQLRLAIVQDTQRDMPHAVLAVYTPQGLFVLDNQIKTLVAADKVGRYRPIYSINRQAWWLHTTPRETMIAAAAGE